MVEWSIDAFRVCGSVHSIVVAAPSGHVGELAGHRDLGVVPGGATRAQSVANALEAVGTELVAIHDAARPLLTPELVEALVARLDDAPEAAGVIAATPITDTVKQATPGSPDNGTSPPFSIHGMEKGGFAVEGTLDRARLWAAQTPQVFRTDALREALAVEPETHGAATDEAMLVEVAGGTVLIHPAPAHNLKVTTPLDLRVAELLLSERAAGTAPAG
jgi:2-C-methyl-D-erythritol 4-phosphate cytidylyltransferase